MNIIKSSRKHFLLEKDDIETFVDIVDNIYGENIHIKYLFSTIDEEPCLLWYPLSSVIRLKKIEEYFRNNYTNIIYFESLKDFENRKNKN